MSRKKQQPMALSYVLKIELEPGFFGVNEHHLFMEFEKFVTKARKSGKVIEYYRTSDTLVHRKKKTPSS